MKLTTLCLLLRDDEILLAVKKRGFGVGKLNGIGGKVDKGESIVEAAVRELKEEVGVTADLKHLESIGDIKFYFKNKSDWDQHMHIFFVKNWEGEPAESEEMKPEWHKQQNIPFDRMWSDDRHWIPLVLSGKKIKGEFYFNEDDSNFDKFEIKEV